MEESKKSGGGDVRAEALAWDDERDKARKLVFSFISTLDHGGSLCAPLTSLAARKKSRFAEKKSASPKKNTPTAFLNHEFRVGADKVLQFGYKSYCHSCCLVGFLVRNYIAAIGRG